MAEVRPAVQTLLMQFVGRTDLEPEMALFHDVGMSGDDAWELLAAVNRQFATNFEAMCFSDYFSNEAEALGFHLFRWRRRAKRRLTIAHLERVIDRGVWFEVSGAATTQVGRCKV